MRALVRAARRTGDASLALSLASRVEGAAPSGAHDLVAWIARLVSPVRVAVTSRLPPRILYGAALALTIPLWIVLAAVYRPASRAGLAWVRRFLFYYPYLGYISRFPFWEVHTIVHDHLAAPVSHYLRHEQVEAWYRGAGAREVHLAWHNRNSWRGFGILPGSREAVGEAGPGGAHR